MASPFSGSGSALFPVELEKNNLFGIRIKSAGSGSKSGPFLLKQIQK
jgi:hypothetical protein